jgi:hypothetical protein
MINPIINHRLFFTAMIIMTFIAQSCVVTHYNQGAKTIPENHLQVGAGLYGGSFTDFYSDFDENDDFDEDLLILPFFDFYLGARYGIGPRNDLGAMYSFVSTTTSLDYKHMIIGDQQSKFAMASGAHISGALGTAFIGHFQAEIPLYLSVHPNEYFSAFVIPRIGLQRIGLNDILFNGRSNFWHYGLGAGINFGNEKYKGYLAYNTIKLQTDQFILESFTPRNRNLGLGVIINFSLQKNYKSVSPKRYQL